MNSIFSKDSRYKNRARWLAVAWTLLIFILCLLPGDELPEVQIPLADKWAHVILFGVFSFLWLCAVPTRNISFLLILLVITIFLGWLVEYIQGHFVKGRTQDNMDTLADGIGGITGISLFVWFHYLRENKEARNASKQ